MSSTLWTIVTAGDLMMAEENPVEGTSSMVAHEGPCRWGAELFFPANTTSSSTTESLSSSQVQPINGTGISTMPHPSNAIIPTGQATL